MNEAPPLFEILRQSTDPEVAVFNKVHTPQTTMEIRPGPVRIAIENSTDVRVHRHFCIGGESGRRRGGGQNRCASNPAPHGQPHRSKLGWRSGFKFH